ncbi:MAG: hypothetical protein LAT81_14765, partial [Oceanicaulis sp.]|nr:hypothetical protein [Oceanicaulis sp.]
MSKTSFSEEENKAYEQLADMTAQGLSQFVDDLIRHRGFVQDNFQRLFREAKNTLNERMQDAPSRLISNISVLIAFYQLFKDIVFFPFSMQDALDHFAIGVEKQVRKLNSASVINRWWDCFLASMRGTKDDKLLIHRDYKLDGNTLYFNFTMVYNKIQRQWWSQYHENAPGKASMQDVLKKNEGFMQEKSSVRIGQGKEGTKTSAYVIDLNSIGYIGQEVKDAINFQLDEMGLIMKDVLEEKETENKTPDGLSFSDDDNEPDF